MARLRSAKTGQVRALSESATVGRDPQSWIILSTPCASSRHAEFLYRGGCWMLMDTSTNGSWVAGQRVSQVGWRLTPGQTLRFGGEDGETFEMLDTQPPEPVALDVADRDRRVEGEDGVLSLGDGPDGVSIYTVDDAWVLDQGGARRSVLDAELLPLGSTTWRLRLPGAQAATVEALSDPATTLLIRYSPGFEDLELALRGDAGDVTPLGPRAYAGMLLLMAQWRQAELDEGVEDGEAGWFSVPDLLIRMSRGAPKVADRQQLNTYRLRFTNVLEKHGAIGAAAPQFERRLDSDRIRLIGPVAIEPL